MSRRRRFQLTLALGALCTLPALLLVRRAADAQRRALPTTTNSAGRSNAAVAGSAGAVARRVPNIASTVEGFDPSRARRDRSGRFVAELPGNRRAVLTVDPATQRAVAALVDAYEIPRSSVVVLDTDTGRVRAYYSHGEPGATDLARDATPPAASVFKIVTSSALIERGFGEQVVTCYSGGFHALHDRDLQSDARRDHDCVTLAQAFGRSLNTVFARRAVERLTPPDLLRTAQAWGFGEALPFDAAVTPGTIDVPAVPLEFARTAAGFWHSHMSPLHGAVIAQAIARDGEMQRPFIVDSITDAQGVVLASGAPQAWRRAVSPEVAHALARMMTHSVTEGTARNSFRDPAGTAYLPEVRVSGKTGTLTGDTPYRAYTWFVGNASSATTRVSFAVMVANGPVWRVRAATLARQVLQIVYRGRSTN